jgi:hypothetical protein
MLATIEVESVVVENYPVVDSYSIEFHVARLKDAHAMIRAVFKKCVADREILALIEDQQMSPQPAWNLFAVVFGAGKEFFTLAIHDSSSLVQCFPPRRINQHNIPVAGMPCLPYNY